MNELERALSNAWEIMNNGPLNNDNIQRVRYAIREAKTALTPPTADEVCEALREYWGNPVNYDERHNLFEMYVGDNIWKPIDLLRLREHAPHLIIMIGRFYEGAKG